MTRSNKLLLTAVIIYVAVSSFGIFSAWFGGQFEFFDLSNTVSIYVGLTHLTAAVYFAGIAAIAFILHLIIQSSELNIIRRILFYISLIFLIGIAWFPVQYNRSETLASRGHEFFSNGYFAIVIATLFLMIVFENARQKIYGIAGVLFGIAYVVCYAMNVVFFRQFILLWETTLIYFYIGEFLFLKPKSDSGVVSSKKLS